jgi:hypothetical protein
MFILAIVIAIVLGYILKGSIKNIDLFKINAIYLIYIAIAIEAIVKILMRNKYLSLGITTLIIDLIMYGILVFFIYLNRSIKAMLIVGLGFILNAMPIFSNGGAMPVGRKTLEAMGFIGDVTSHGLYTLVESNTRFAFLGDVIFLKYPRPNAISIGDIVLAIGIICFIITEMQTKKTNINYIKLEQ